MWKLNDLEFDSFEAIKAFVESEAFMDYADHLNPFDLMITGGDDRYNNVSGALHDRKPIYIVMDKLSDMDWTTTYTTPNTMPEKDETPEQRAMLKQLRELEEIVNRRLDEE